MMILKFFAFLLPIMFGIRIFFLVTDIFSHFKSPKFPIRDFLSFILLEMRTGRVVENAISQFFRENPRWKDFENEIKTKNGQNLNEKWISVVKNAVQRPSQALTILEFFRQRIIDSQTMERKLAAASTQAKGQVLVSGLLYGIVVLAQYSMNPLFQKFLSNPDGKLIISISFLLLAIGTHLVFKLARPRGFLP